MTLVYLGIYILILASIWGFFIVAKIHAYKFKNMSTQIVLITNALFIILLVLSLIGFILIFFLDGNNQRDLYIEDYNEDTVRLEQENF